jgi:hypothetical protein
MALLWITSTVGWLNSKGLALYCSSMLSMYDTTTTRRALMLREEGEGLIDGALLLQTTDGAEREG